MSCSIVNAKHAPKKLTKKRMLARVREILLIRF
jgi:hypothetical protein